MALINKYILLLWNSPTFTAWAGKGSQSIRLLIVLPLILRNFDEVQIAAWLLFGSLAFFTQIIFQQTSQIFSRMIALAVGGAEDLSPIKPGDKPRGNGSPNWGTISKLYGTIGGLNLFVSILGIVVTFSIGGVAFRKLLEHYEKSNEIWIAFAIFVCGDFIAQVFRRYAITLRGLNQVALTNRWDAVFALISAVSGSIGLLAGASIIGLSIIVQFFNILKVFRLRFFLFKWVEPRFKAFRPCSIDKNILGYLFTPLWRALVQSYVIRGGVKIGIIIYTQYATATELASMLLLLRLLDTAQGIAVAPISSHVPRFSRLLSEGKAEQLTNGVIRAMTLAQWVLVLSFIGIAFAAPLGLSLIETTVSLPSSTVTALLLLTFHLFTIITYSLLLTVLGNNYILIGRMGVAALITLLSGPFLIGHYGQIGFIICTYLPFILLLNLSTLKYSAMLMDTSTSLMFKKVFIWPLFSSICMATILLSW